MRILLVRHGEALDSPYPEILRPLSPRGRKRVRRLAKKIASLGIPVSRIFASPLTRAVQTAEILLAILRKSSPVREVDPRIELASDFLSPAFDRNSFLELLAGCEGESLVFVGHEPNLVTLASWIDGEMGRTGQATAIGRATALLLEWELRSGGHFQGRISPG